jgi:hypothetical protein
VSLGTVIFHLLKPDRPIRIENPFKKPDSPSVAFENPFYAIRNPPSGPVQNTQVDASEDYNSYLSSSWPSDAGTSASESSSENTTPRSPDDTEVKQSTLMDKMDSLRTEVSHGQGFQRF